MADTERTSEAGLAPARAKDNIDHEDAAKLERPLSVRLGYGAPESLSGAGGTGTRSGSEQPRLPVGELPLYKDGSNVSPDFAITGGARSGSDGWRSPSVDHYYGSPFIDEAKPDLRQKRAASDSQPQVLDIPALFNERPPVGGDGWQRNNPYPVNNNPYDGWQRNNPYPVNNNPYDGWQRNNPSDNSGQNRDTGSAQDSIVNVDLRAADLLFKQIQTTMSLLNAEIAAVRHDLDSISQQLNQPVPRPDEQPRPQPVPDQPVPRPDEQPRPQPVPDQPVPRPDEQPRPQPVPDQPHPQPAPDSVRHHGVSLAGAEFAPYALPGKAGKEYIFPTTQELDYYKGKGMDLIRVPFLWERMQPGLLNKQGQNDNVDRAFSPEYAKQMDDFLAAADERGMKIVLDAHDYGRYNNQVVGESNITNDDFKQFWGQMAKTFGQHSSVYGYDLSNEPHDEAPGTWQAAAQGAVDGIRAAGDKHAVVVEGNQWSGTQSWTQLNNDFAVQDPENNVIYGAHSYWDSDHSGQYNGGAQESYRQAVQDARNKGVLGPDEDPSDLGVNDAKPFVEWLKAHHARGYIGEYGVPSNDPDWVKMQDKFLAYARQNNVDTSAWGAGPWWGSEYVMSLEHGSKGEQSVNGPEPLNLKSIVADGNGV